MEVLPPKFENLGFVTTEGKVVRVISQLSLIIIRDNYYESGQKFMILTYKFSNLKICGESSQIVQNYLFVGLHYIKGV